MRALLVLGLLACNTGMQRTEDLVTDVRSFQEGLRWRKYEAAANYVPANLREAFLEAHDELDEDLRIDDYELERIKLEDTHTAAMVRVKYTWHRESVGSVHDTVVEQRWERQGKVWRVVTNERMRGTEMPPSVVVSKAPPLP